MAFHYSPKIATDNLDFCLDTANPKSFLNGDSSIKDMMGKKSISLVNGVTYDSNNSGSLVFDGINQYCLYGTSYPLTSQMSFDIWLMRYQSNNIYNMVFSYSLPYLSFRNINTFFFSFNTRLSGVSTQRSYSTTNTYLDNTWYNVCCTLDQNLTTGDVVSNIYVNGEIEKTYSLSGVVDSIVQPITFRLGDHTGVSYPFNGRISNMKVYSKILSSDEVRQNYRALKNRFL